jgi:uncharacterized protein YqgC (DUF456 family)
VLLSNASDAAVVIAAAQAAAAQTTAANSAQAVTTTQQAVDLAFAALAAAQATVPNFLPLDLAGLKAKLPQVYGDATVGQELPIVAQSIYNQAFGKTWSDAPQADGTKAFATIFTGSLQEPSFRFTPGTPNGGFDKLTVTSGGAGYITPPVPLIGAPAGAGGVQATAITTLSVGKVNVVNAGSGYKFVPIVAFTNTGTGSGASAVARMQVSKVLINNGGSGYSAATLPAVTFSAPDNRFAGAIQATGTAIVDALGVVTGVTITEPGTGYSANPLIAIEAPVAGTRATGSTELSIRSLDLVSTDPNHPEFAGGAGYNNMGNLTVAIDAPTTPGGVTAQASVTGAVSDITLLNPGRGYTGLPSVTLPTPAGGIAATAVAAAGGGSILVKSKAIQELFDPTYGRMNATLGIEIPFTSAMTQTTIPLGYVDPVTEEFADGETQIWKITHNGVDAHPVHFHLLNVQVINRIGWDGTIKQPHANEYGWKETLIMNPLEDIMVAVRAKKPVLPGFGLPFSVRLRDPSQPDGVPMGFTQINAVTGMPAAITNKVDNFGWEYVWHCHILGHEENDFMRPVKFNANEVVPAAPSALILSAGNLTWADNASTEYKYQVYTVTSATGASTLAQTLLANATGATVATPATGTTLAVIALGANGNSGALLTTPAAPGVPTAMTAAMASTTSIRFSWAQVTGAASYQAQISADGGLSWTNLNGAVTGTTTRSITATALAANNTYLFRVQSKGVATVVNGVNLTVTSAFTAPVSVVIPALPGIAAISSAITMAQIGVSTTDRGTMTVTPPTTGGATVSYSVQYSAAAVAPAGNVGWTTVSVANTTVTGNTVSFVVPRGTAGTTKYWVRVAATNAAGAGVYSTVVQSPVTQ